MRLPRYSEYKDSGVEWLGQVPTHWGVVRLKSLAHQVSEKATQRQRPVGLENIESWSGRFIPTNSEFEGEGVAFRLGDILFGKLRPYLAKVYLADSCGEAVGDFHVIRPGRKMFGRYLQFAMLNRAFIDIVDGSTFGSKMPRASWDSLGSMPTPVPPIIEQSAIADFLGRETAKIDALIGEQGRLLALLAEKRQAIIFHAVTKGVDPDAPMKDSGVTWVGRVPAHWGIVRVKDVARLESGHTPSKQVSEYWEDCDIPWVSLNDSKHLAQNDYISETAVKISLLGMQNSSARLLPPGAVVFTRDATIGLAAITRVPMAVSQHIIAWCPSRHIRALYLLRVFNAMKEHLDSYTFGATIKTIGMADVRTLVTPAPPIEEQVNIENFIGRKISGIDGAVLSVERSIALLKERRAALVSAAVTGQIDVREVC